MENNKFLYAIFTICVVILVLLIVQMCILLPMAMHHHHHPMMSAAPVHQHSFQGKPMMPPKHPFPRYELKDDQNLQPAPQQGK